MYHLWATWTGSKRHVPDDQAANKGTGEVCVRAKSVYGRSLCTSSLSGGRSISYIISYNTRNEEIKR